MTTLHPWCLQFESPPPRSTEVEEKMAEYKETLRRLALNDETFVAVGARHGP